MNGAELIAAERQRQIEQEGWTPEHDAMHDGGELAIAAACYAVEGTYADVVVETGQFGTSNWEQSDAWPWNGWDKREQHDKARRLVIAGALIAAEIDRLNAEPAPTSEPETP